MTISDHCRTVLIVNPNTDQRVTGWLADEARRVAGNDWIVRAVNAASGLAAIQTPADRAIAGKAVLAAIQNQPDVAGALIGAFGDPGLEEARAARKTPVAGLGESGILAAADGGRRFAIVTLGQAMREAVEAQVGALGLTERLAAIRFLPVAIADLVADRDALRPVIGDAIRDCIEQDAAEAILLGGAPFAGLALSFAQSLGVTVLDGVEASIIRVSKGRGPLETVLRNAACHAARAGRSAAER
jgi:Asp/Glu/hydantoin racemase